MKVLIEDKIVDTFSFPLSEAMSFSILLWTIWGFVEAFFWERFLPFVDPGAERIDPWIYVASFFIYISVAVIVGLLAYVMVKLTLFSSEKSEKVALFRGATLASILAFFFLFVLGYHLPYSVAQSSLSSLARYALIAVTIVFALAAVVFLYRRASAVGFRIRRSGATMFSILVLSLVFSLVRFPLFSESNPDRASGLSQAVKKLTVYQYAKALLPEDKR